MKEHYFVKKPRVKFKLGLIRIQNLRGFDLEIYTSPGIFSWKEIDRGTWVLIENMKVKRGWKVLDLGCGYGIIGIIASFLASEGKVILTDVNERACELARMNLEKLKIRNAKVRLGELYSAVKGEKFDSIICNPPLSVGLEICYKIIDGAKENLKKGGLLQLVARHRKGGKRLKERMISIFGNCEVLKKSGGYWVYASEKTD
jgi:16S rRNA G1207 methylase RsmC